MGTPRNISDDSTLAYLFQQDKRDAKEALAKAVETLKGDLSVLENEVSGVETELYFTENAIAIVSTGDDHATISTGQYVYIRGHSTLAEGLYLATASIPQGTALSTANVTPVNAGGLNALNDKITNSFRWDGLISEYTLEESRGRTTNATGGVGTVTLSVPGLYILECQTTANNISGQRSYCRFTGTGVTPIDYNPSTVNAFWHQQYIQFLFVGSTSVSVNREYYDTRSTGSKHVWRIWRIGK